MELETKPKILRQLRKSHASIFSLPVKSDRKLFGRRACFRRFFHGRPGDVMSSNVHSISRALRLCVILATLLLASTTWAQTPPGSDRIVVIADFERANEAWQLDFKPNPSVRGYIEISSLQTPAHAGSAGYVNISFTGKDSNGLKIFPARPVRLDGYVRRITIWVYGFGEPDELFLDLLDHRARPHRLFLGRLDFHGWKQLSVKPPPHLLQRAGTIGNDRSGLAFRSLFLRPHYKGKEGLCRLYVDTVEAVVRPYFLHPELKWRY